MNQSMAKFAVLFIAILVASGCADIKHAVSDWWHTRPPAVGDPTAPPESTDAIDLKTVTWVHAAGQDISSWPVVATLGAVEIRLPQVCSSGVSWPANWPKFGGKNVQANHVVLANIDGRWYGGAWEALNIGAANTCRPLETIKNGQSAKWGPFGQVEKDPFWTWRPQRGDLVGFLVTSWIRSGVTQPVGRSNVVMVKWP